MRRQTSVWLSLRTSLERIAPESLTLALYSFVHGDIWEPPAAPTQDGVVTDRFKRVLDLLNVNTVAGFRRRRRVNPEYVHCVFVPLADARAGTGTEMNSDASSTAWPMGVGPCMR